jgi:hypothetical protein
VLENKNILQFFRGITDPSNIAQNLVKGLQNQATRLELVNVRWWYLKVGLLSLHTSTHIAYALDSEVIYLAALHALEEIQKP